MSMEEKTNVMRLLDGKKIKYKSYFLDLPEAVSGTELAQLLGKEEKTVFKTLVTAGKSNTHYVFVIPSNMELDLKKAAKAVGEKSVDMIKSKELLPLTGYVHGGCSPIGMKKDFPTYFDETVILYDKITVSAGIKGCQLMLSQKELIDFIGAAVADLTVL